MAMTWTPVRRGALVLLALAGAAQAKVPLHLEDTAYLLQATAAATERIELGQLAQEKASDPRVRRFAQHMVAEYTKRRDALTALGKPYGVPAMTELEPWAAWRFGELKGLEGAQFDATYVAGEEPALDAEQWMSLRAGRHATRESIRREAAAVVAPIHKDWKEALRLTVKHEPELPAGRPHPDDASMILFAMNVDMAQIALGNLAAEKGTTDKVRDFAKKMIDDHSASLEMLKTLAHDRGLAPIAGPGPLEVLVLTQLQSLDGPAFDEAYMEGQVIFHDNWYKRIEYTANNGKDEAVKAYAQVAHKLGIGHHDQIFATMTGKDAPPHDAATHDAMPHDAMPQDAAPADEAHAMPATQ